MNKWKKDSFIFLATALAVVLVAVTWYGTTTDLQTIEATPSENCMACHMDANIIESMYEIPEEEPAGGGG